MHWTATFSDAKTSATPAPAPQVMLASSVTESLRLSLSMGVQMSILQPNDSSTTFTTSLTLTHLHDFSRTTLTLSRTIFTFTTLQRTIRLRTRQRSRVLARHFRWCISSSTISSAQLRHQSSKHKSHITNITKDFHITVTLFGLLSNVTIAFLDIAFFSGTTRDNPDDERSIFLLLIRLRCASDLLADCLA